MGGIRDRLQSISRQVSSLQEKRTDTMTDYKFFGWVGKDKDSIGKLSWEEYEPKTWTEDDIDIKISMVPFCAIRANS